MDDDRKMYLQVRNLLWFCLLSLLFIWACDQRLLVLPTPQRNSHCGWRKGKLSTRSRKNCGWACTKVSCQVTSVIRLHVTIACSQPLYFSTRAKKKKKSEREGRRDGCGGRAKRAKRTQVSCQVSCFALAPSSLATLYAQSSIK